MTKTIADATVEWIGVLIELGWSVRWIGTRSHFEWRSPKGISGCDYHTSSLEMFPDGVIEAIRKMPRSP